MFTSPQELDLELDRDELDRFIHEVRAKYSYDFANYAQSSFKRRVAMVLKKHGIKRLNYLTDRVLADAVFFDQVLLDITVNTTEMFRDPTFWKYLRLHVLPELAKRPELAIWHAACSSGEEVLSMAILLKEEGLFDRARVYATDINHKVLKRAADGRYAARNLELFRTNYLATGAKTQLEAYYQLQGGDPVFDRGLLERVNFRPHDLALEGSFGKFDLVFCRNVMIYFNQTLQNRVFELLHDSLFLGGFLALGAKESLIWCRIADKFQTVSDHEKIYRKLRA